MQCIAEVVCHKLMSIYSSDMPANPYRLDSVPIEYTGFKVKPQSVIAPSKRY